MRYGRYDHPIPPLEETRTRIETGLLVEELSREPSVNYAVVVPEDPLHQLKISPEDSSRARELGIDLADIKGLYQSRLKVLKYLGQHHARIKRLLEMAKQNLETRSESPED